MRIHLFFYFISILVFPTAVLAQLKSDLNGDFQTNWKDLFALSEQWKEAGAGDLNGDGIVEQADILEFAGLWNAESVSPPLDNVADPGAFRNVAPDYGFVGQTYSYLPVLESSIQNPVFQLELGPAGMTCSATDGETRWKPESAQSGTHRVVLAAAAGGTTYRQGWGIAVVERRFTSTQTIGNGGGTVSGDGAIAEVPASAVDDDLDFSIGVMAGAPDTEAKTDVLPVSEVFSIEARHPLSNIEQQTFAEPLRITLPYDLSILPAGQDPESLRVFNFDPTTEHWLFAIPATVNTSNHTLTFETTHLTDFMVGFEKPPNHPDWALLAESENFQIYYFRVFQKDEAAATLYAQTVLAAMENAIVLADNAGFTPTPDTIVVRIHEEGGSEGHYDWNIFGTPMIYMDWNLSDAAIRTTAIHEYFHALQDDIYNMTFSKITQVYWWTEASSVWSETLIDPAAPSKYVDNPRGFLRIPLEDPDREAAYTKGTFAAYVAGEVNNFVLDVYTETACGTCPEIRDAIDSRFDLETRYKDYVLDMLEQYNTGVGPRLDGDLLLLENGNGLLRDFYKLDGTEADSFTFQQVSAENGTLTVEFIDQLGQPLSNRARIYLISARDADSKRVRIRYEPPNNDPTLATPVVVSRGQNNAVLKEETVPFGSFVDVRNFGIGGTDSVRNIVLVGVEAHNSLFLDQAPPVGKWTVEVIEQPPLADLTYQMPATGGEDGAIIEYTPGEFDFPTIFIDFSQAPLTDRFQFSIQALTSSPFEFLDAPWSVAGVTLADNPFDYGDATIGTFNTARDGRPAPPLDTYDQFKVALIANEGNTVESELFNHYVDGPVSFTFTFNPDTITPRHFENGSQVGPTPVSINISVTNGSSIPFVLDGFDVQIAPGENAFGYPLEPDGNAFVVDPDTTGQLTIDEVELEFDQQFYGTTQTPKLIVNNDVQIADPNLMWKAVFWHSARSETTTLSINQP